MYKVTNGRNGDYVLKEVRITGKSGFVTLWCNRAGRVQDSEYFDNAGNARGLRRADELRQANAIAKLHNNLTVAEKER